MNFAPLCLPPLSLVFAFLLLPFTFCLAFDPASSRPLERRDYAAAGWPQLQRDAARTGQTPDSPAPPYELAWAISLQPETVGTIQPIIYKDILYVPTLQGRLYALAPKTGERLWVQDGLGAISRTPAATGDLVYTANAEGMVHAVKTGRTDPDGGGKNGVAWTADLGFGISATLCVDNGRIYIGTRNGAFFCLDGNTGEVVWKRQLEGYVWSGAAVADVRVYVATDRAIRMHCMDANTGKELWKSGRLPGILASLAFGRLRRQPGV